MLSAIFIGIGTILILMAKFGHHHAERGAHTIGHSRPALSHRGAYVMGILFILFGLIVLSTGL
jgi:hypothetical protein